jgi:glycerol uptake facilitator-like aquaporin
MLANSHHGGVGKPNHNHHRAFFGQPTYYSHLERASSSVALPPPSLPEAAACDFAQAPRWRSLVDNFLVECIATLLLHTALLFCWEEQPIPSVVLGLMLLCIKDEDYFFPDGSPSVTIVIWVLGGYSWTHALMRILGQIVGTSLAVAVRLSDTPPMPALEYRVQHAPGVVFGLELIGTLVEHMAVVYVLLPLLPPSQHPTPTSRSLARIFPKVKPKSHSETQAPSNQAVVHAAAILSLLHWSLTWGLCVELTPLGTLARAIVSNHVWEEAVLAWWGQVVGITFCIAYVALYTPRTRPHSPPSPSA